MTDRRKQFIKYRYLVRYLFQQKKEFLKSTFRTAFDTDRRFCLSVHSSIRTDGQTKITKDRYLNSDVVPFQQKKRILKIRRLELILEGGYGLTDGHLADVKTYFPFFKFFELKKGK